MKVKDRTYTMEEIRVTESKGGSSGEPTKALEVQGTVLNVRYQDSCLQSIMFYRSWFSVVGTHSAVCDFPADIALPRADKWSILIVLSMVKSALHCWSMIFWLLWETIKVFVILNVSMK